MFKKKNCKSCKNIDVLLKSNNELLEQNKELQKRIDKLENDKQEHKGILLDLVDKIRIFLTKNYNEVYKLSVHHKSQEEQEEEEEWSE